MPGLSMPSAFGTVARTMIERVVGSSRESMLATMPANSRFGKATLLATTGSPS
jgi:hypothetical protein